MAVGDISELLLSGSGDGIIPLINRFAYQQTTGPGTVPPSFLVTQFISNILPSIIAIVNVLTVYHDVTVKQLTGGTDIASQPLTTGNTGLRTGGFSTSNECWSFRYFRSSTTSRNGWKRIGLVSEADTNNGVAFGTVIPLLNTCATALGQTLTDGTTTYEPRILRTRRNGAPVIPPQVFSVSSVGYVHLGSQNTRKFIRH